VRRLVAALAIVALAGVALAEAAPPRRIRVDVFFRESGTRATESSGARGGVIVTERGLSRGSLGLEATSRETRTRRSSGVFTLVQDGGESRLSLATRVPFREASWIHDYALGAGYAVERIRFEDVGTSLLVRANLLDDGRIRVSLVPSVSWFAADGSGAIDFTEAATEVVVRPGEELVIGGGTRDLHETTRRILGSASASESSESSIVLRARLD
jgi:type II secretory pathway component HofQ